MKKEETHVCKFDVMIISNQFIDGKEKIDVILDCMCPEDKTFENVMSFEDNSFLSANDNFSGWLSQVAPYLIQNGYKIQDFRSYKIENDDEN